MLSEFSGELAIERGIGTDFETGASAAIRVRAEALNGSRVKRVFDTALAACLVVILLPALLLIASAILIDSPGPVLFRQERYGKDRRIFKVFKFRTMRVLESRGPFTQAKPGDARLTRVGWLLRRTSLDELPQLLNVLKGDMSLVGPRPHAVAMDDLFSKVLLGYGDRHLVRPGMTGLAQVCGHRGPTDTSLAMSERLLHDRTYIQAWSIWLDLTILARTPLSLIHHNAL